MVSDLAGCFSRSRLVRRCAALLGCVAALVVLAAMLIDAVSLSGPQLIERDLGVSQYRLKTMGDIHPDQAAAAMASTPDNADVRLVIETYDLVVDSMPHERVRYREGRLTEQFPKRFKLLKGRWPSAPGEVVVTQALQDVKDPLSVFGGRARWSVVGVVVDDFSRPSRQVIAAPGTFASLNTPAITQAYSALGAAVVAFGDDPVRMAAALEPWQPKGLDSAEPMSAEGRAAFEAGERGLAERQPIYFVLPALTALVAAAAASGILISRHLRRSMRVLATVGLPQRKVRGAAAVAVTVSHLIAVAIGIALATGVEHLLALNGAPLFWQPLEPAKIPWLWWGVACLLPAGIGVSVVLGGIPWNHLAERVVRLVPVLTWCRRAAAAVLTLLLMLRSTSEVAAKDVTPVAIQAALVVACLVPDVWRGLNALPRRHPAPELSRRICRQRSMAHLVLIVVLTLASGIPLSAATLAATMQQLSESQNVASVPHGMALLKGDGRVPADPKLAAQLEGMVNRPPHRLSECIDDRGVVDVGLPTGGVLIVVDSEDTVREILGSSLTDEQRAAFHDGFLIAEAPTENPVQLNFEGEHGDKRGPRLRAATISLPKELRKGQGWSGLISRAVAQREHLPTDGEQEFLFTGLDARQERIMEAAPTALSFDRYFLNVNVPPPPVQPSVSVMISLAGTGVLILLLMVAVGRLLVRAMRPSLAGLQALGIRRAWLASALTHQLVGTMGLALVGGLVIALVPPIMVAYCRPMPFPIALPWQYFAMTITTAIVGVLGSLIWSLHALRPSMRHS